MAIRSILPRPARQAKEPTNIHLHPVLKQKAARVAVERHGLSLTGMITRFLERETTTKKGILNSKLR